MMARKISPATRAIMVVHFAGYPLDLARLSGILDEAEAAYGFRPVVIEDCAHAWGATYQGVPLGNHGNISVFSFQAIKHLTCVDGGLLVLPDDELNRRARLLRWFGIDRDTDRLRKAPDVEEWGYKFHMNDVNAAIGLANLAGTDEVLRRHRDNAAFYDEQLAGVPGLDQIHRAEFHSPSYWVYPVRHQREPGARAQRPAPVRPGVPRPAARDGPGRGRADLRSGRLVAVRGGSPVRRRHDPGRLVTTPRTTA
jgi:dTDP-4-amino-4,6-dideoxy-D-glucose/dTDP-4-amino-2,4-dideoxy-beta-L-xylose transaminase